MGSEKILSHYSRRCARDTQSQTPGADFSIFYRVIASVRSFALVTAACLIGGIVLAIAIGSAVDALLSWRWLFAGRGLAAVAALAIFALAARFWGQRVSELSGVGDPGRTGMSTAFFVGIPLIVMGGGLAPLEPVAVRVASGWGLPIHAAYIGLFVPATLIVAAIGSFGLGRGLRDKQLGLRLAAVAAPFAAASFLAAALVMYAIGWHVGGPGAGRRATMLVVTAVSATAAALAAGAAIGMTLRRTQPTSG
jgi:hypothetical protein